MATRVCASDTVKHRRLGDQVHAALVNAPDSWLPAPMKVTILSAALPTASTELEVTLCGILKAFDIASATPLTRLDELKTNHLSVALTLPRGGMRNEDVGERKGKASEERLILKLKESKWSTRKNVAGKTMWDEEPQNVLRDDEKFESRGDVEADDLLTEGQQQAMQCVLRDPEMEPNGNDPAKCQYNQSRLMDLQFNRNAEAAHRRADRAKIER
ncbi:hypothetical protein HOY80DRAFT_1134908 [Tuber brumale]|nr:hypothetical protein HOY80DRAFT_1134908 [Tuber brumale]